MARKFVTPLDLQKNELQNARVQNLAGAPAAPVVGQIYVETTGSVNRLFIWNGTAFVLFATDSDKLGGQTLAQVRDFSLTTGVRPATAISDFDTQVRTSRLDQLAAPTAAVSLGGQKITNLADPTLDTDAANKRYVDTAVNGFDWKASVRAATTANVALATGGIAAAVVLDGVTLATGNRVLVKNQTTGSENGLYIVPATGAAVRSTDADASVEVTSGLAVFVEEGTTVGNQQWVLTTDNPITLGTTALVFSQVGATGSAPIAGNGLTLVSNTYDVVPGLGLAVTADSVLIDTAVVVRKFAQAFGDGAAVAFTITHNLGTQDVTVGVYLNSGTFEEVIPDIEHPTVNTVIIRFAVAPATNSYRVVVHG